MSCLETASSVVSLLVGRIHHPAGKEAGPTFGHLACPDELVFAGRGSVPAGCAMMAAFGFRGRRRGRLYEDHFAGAIQMVFVLGYMHNYGATRGKAGTEAGPTRTILQAQFRWFSYWGTCTIVVRPAARPAIR